MRIALVSRGDASSGGAGRVAEQLARRHNQRGHQVTHFVREPPRPGYSEAVRELPRIRGDVLLRNAIALDPSGARLLLQEEIWRADIVHFHDHVVAWGAAVAHVVARRRPILLTLHDFSGITGGCLNPRDCKRYQMGCGECPQLGSWPLALPLDLTRLQFRINRSLLQRDKVHIVVPSRYLKTRASRGAAKNASMEVIPNGVDIELFHPARRESGRRRLGVPPEARVLLFVAYDVDAPDKGFGDLALAYARLAEAHPALHLAVVGRLSTLPKTLARFRDRIRVLGSVTRDEILAELYAGSDVFVTPTRADNFPCTVLEAMASGTPVLAYPTGGIPEILVAGSGYLTERRDVGALTDSLQEILSEQPFDRDSARRRAEQLSLASCVDRYENLYEKIRSESS